MYKLPKVSTIALAALALGNISMASAGSAQLNCSTQNNQGQLTFQYGVAEGEICHVTQERTIDGVTNVDVFELTQSAMSAFQFQEAASAETTLTCGGSTSTSSTSCSVSSGGDAPGLPDFPGFPSFPGRGN